MNKIEKKQRFIDTLITSIHHSASYNSQYEEQPRCILWPDKEKQWESVLDILQKEIPELFILGPYKPESRQGPAIWLRCVLSETIPSVSIPAGTIPIIYLPGYSLQELKPVDKCPDELKIIVSYQYLGVIWSQVNNKDWTVLSMLQSSQGGLGLDVGQDNETRTAIHTSLKSLLYTDVSSLKGKHLSSDYFYALLSEDTDRSFLEWINQGDTFKQSIDPAILKALSAQIKSKFNFDIEANGILLAAQNLANHKTKEWKILWERFCEAPNRFPNIPSQIRKCQLPETDSLFADDEGLFNGWPQWNSKQEDSLRCELLSLSTMEVQAARKKILSLEGAHKNRRTLLWAELKEAALARSMEYLAKIAVFTQKGINAGTFEDITKAYIEFGWQVDDAVLKSLESIEREDDRKAVFIAITAIYKPWIEESSLYVQKLVSESKYPLKSIDDVRHYEYEDGDCILFIDGLRFDIAHRLIELIKNNGMSVEYESVFAALPTVTGTGKAAVIPCSEKISGDIINEDFVPNISENNQRADSSRLRKLLENNGWTYLGHSSERQSHEYSPSDKFTSGDDIGKAWCEEGNIDHEGHTQGLKFAKGINAILDSVKDRISRLFKDGWKRVYIVSDHGWLFLPGYLPRDVKLSSDLTESKWGRCAVPKESALIDHTKYHWFWNQTQSFISANGVNSFYSGSMYNHGGISLQECLLMRLCITNQPQSNAGTLTIKNVKWQGLTCKIYLNNPMSGTIADIRSIPADKGSSFALQVKTFKEDGTVLLYINEDHEGKDAYIVVLDQNDSILTQMNTTVGKE